MRRRQRLLGIGQRLFIELLAGPEPGVFDADVGFVESRQPDHLPGEIGDQHGLAHVEHIDLAALAHLAGLQH